MKIIARDADRIASRLWRTGSYVVRIGLYDYLTGVRLPVTGQDGTPYGDSIALVELEVTERAIGP